MERHMSWLERIDEREARRLARSFRDNAIETRDLAQDHITQFARQARALTEPTLHEALDYARQEGSLVAKAAAKQAMRAGRAVKADPVPAVVGVVGLALLASLVLGRKRT
jgi:hypothetical protein